MAKQWSKCLLVVLGLLWFSSLCGAGDNLILNGVFDEKGPSVGGLSRPNHWQAVDSTQTRLTGEWVTDEAHSGKCSVKLTEPGSFWIQDRINCAAGKYRLTVHVKTDADYQFIFERWKSDRDKVYTYSSSVMKGNGSWEEKSITFDYPGGHKKPYVLLRLTKGGDACWFDDISLVRIK